ncbi:MAG: RNA polymerase sigma-70 factor [Bacteroidia bacterium]
MAQYTEQELALNIKQGDIKSFELLFNTHCSNMLQYATTMLKDSDDAEDIVQQVFVQLWAKHEAVVIETSIKSYLYRAVHNNCLNKIKQQVVRSGYANDYQHIGNTATASVSQLLENKELAVEIQKALDELPEQCKRIFAMSRFEQLKYQQIADALGINVKAVEHQMGKALKHLRNKLKHLMPIVVLLALLGK